MTIGYFNEFRWPLLVDANESCRILNERGVPARIAVVSSMIDPEGARRLAELPYIDVFPDPGNEKLPSYLKGADLLLLAEGFDDGFVSAIHLSISSKAHLFMFSGRPVVVYAHSDTGIAKYAAKNGWAKVVSRRDAGDLTEAFQSLLAGRETTNALVHRADSIAQTFHTHEANRKRLYDSLSGAIPSPR
jgi:glycosyltransferase involved in cell wall biosynthesis